LKIEVWSSLRFLINHSLEARGSSAYPRFLAQ
jgi:hypothetical protein